MQHQLHMKREHIFTIIYIVICLFIICGLFFPWKASITLGIGIIALAITWMIDYWDTLKLANRD